MRAGLRLGFPWLSGAFALALILALGPTPAIGQSTQPATQQSTPPPASPPPATSPPAANTTTSPGSVGPRDLQNFNLGGTVTRRPDPAPAQTSSAPPRRQAADAPASTAGTAGPAGAPPVATNRVSRGDRSSTTAPLAARPDPRVEQSRAVGAATPATASTPATIAQAPPSLAISSGPVPVSPAPAFPTEHRFLLWPWLLAALALAAGGLFLFWRNRSPKGALAGGAEYDSAEYDSYAAPEPAPVPAPLPRAAGAEPSLRPPPQPTPNFLPVPGIPGTITTRLRPWLEIAISPGPFTVEDDRIALEFAIELFNSGKAPARAVLVEATLLNAGNEQDSQLDQFFANPVGTGQRMVSIPPLGRVNFTTEVAIAKHFVQHFEIAEKRVCVPLLALNALYRWNDSNEGQTSASYLVGRDTQSEKLAPFRLDLGARQFRSVGVRMLPNGLRK